MVPTERTILGYRLANALTGEHIFKPIYIAANKIHIKWGLDRRFRIIVIRSLQIRYTSSEPQMHWSRRVTAPGEQTWSSSLRGRPRVRGSSCLLRLFVILLVRRVLTRVFWVGLDVVSCSLSKKMDRWDGLGIDGPEYPRIQYTNKHNMFSIKNWTRNRVLEWWSKAVGVHTAYQGRQVVPQWYGSQQCPFGGDGASTLDPCVLLNKAAAVPLSSGRPGWALFPSLALPPAAPLPLHWSPCLHPFQVGSCRWQGRYENFWKHSTPGHYAFLLLQ
jgi:hypothetical protein